MEISQVIRGKRVKRYREEANDPSADVRRDCSIAIRELYRDELERVMEASN